MAIDDLVIEEIISKVGTGELTPDEVFLIKRFLKIKRVKKGFTKPTCEHYYRDFILFKSFINKKPLLEVNGGDFDDFVEDLERNHNYKKSSICRKLAALKSFYKFLKKEEHIDMNPMSEINSPKIDSTSPIFPTEEQLYKFIEAVKNSKLKTRNLAIVSLILFADARVSEIHNLNIKDITSEKETFEFISKGKKRRSVRIKSIVRDLIEDYLDTRPKVENVNALFLNNHEKRITIRSIQEMVSLYREGINDYITSDRLRQFFKNALDSGMDIGIITNRVKELLREKHLETSVSIKQKPERMKTRKSQSEKDNISQSKLNDLLKSKNKDILAF